MTTTPDPPSLAPVVEVRVSSRRKKSVVAYWQGDRIVVVVPTHLKGSDREDTVHELVERVLRHRPHLHASDRMLMDRAIELGATYLDGVVPASIRWVTNQNRRWGSCTILTREIRISARLRVVPEWVLETVIVHELAHLLEATHSPRFRELEARHPRLHDAAVFLDGYRLGLDMQGSAGTEPECVDDGVPAGSAAALDA